MPEPYHHVRFRWWTSVDLDRLVSEYGGQYNAEKRAHPKDDVELTLYKDQRDEVTLRADTLSVAASAVRAVLFQREAKPFTRLDLALRSEVAHLYDKMGPYRSAPIPEPSFAVEK